MRKSQDYFVKDWIVIMFGYTALFPYIRPYALAGLHCLDYNCMSTKIKNFSSQRRRIESWRGPGVGHGRRSIETGIRICKKRLFHGEGVAWWVQEDFLKAFYVWESQNYGGLDALNEEVANSEYAFRGSKRQGIHSLIASLVCIPPRRSNYNT